MTCLYRRRLLYHGNDQNHNGYKEQFGTESIDPTKRFLGTSNHLDFHNGSNSISSQWKIVVTKTKTTIAVSVVVGEVVGGG